MKTSRGAVWYALIVLFVINALNFFDRNILGAIGEPVRKEFDLSDASLGLLGTAFTLLYAVIGIPFGRFSDKFSRKRILAAGVFIWSLVTAASGLARNFGQLFAMRLGVGVGEAACAPAATSIIGDLFPANWRARAMSIFMLGLPIGIALSYSVSGAVTKAYGWRAAFLVAGLPGVAVSIAVMFIREPFRGGAEAQQISSRRRPGSPYGLILRSPTMLLIILSGIFHNFNMYAISTFLTPYLMRFHKADIGNANYISTFVFGIMGGLGLLVGGYVGDQSMKKWQSGRMLISAVAVMVAAPLIYGALSVKQGDFVMFAALLGVGCMLMYFYYVCVYPAIHDIVEPGLRGTAMAIYFMAFYLLGGSFGPYATGLLSDMFTRRAATAAGVVDLSVTNLEPFKALGLQSAMFVIPFLIVLLALTLYTASRTIEREMTALRAWMDAAADE
ncbi:MAG TPA: MFS transporter [Pyrinomonadaceae bacterium]|jgi:MFS family permease|nr:MFS transporter [Pyrinomonadaceae bacterium]